MRSRNYWEASLSLCNRHLSTKQEGKNYAVYEFDDLEDPEMLAAEEARIKQKQNKSKLFPADYNRQHNEIPYKEPITDFHESLKYRRRLYGKYGSTSGVNPSILWPSTVELNAMKEYEAVAQPYAFHELVERVKKNKELVEKQQKEEEAAVLAKAQNIKKEIEEFHKQVAIRKQKALELIEKKNKLVEEIRRHFGYNIDTRDEKFQKMLAKKQKDEKKANKAAKKALKQELAQLKVEEVKEDSVSSKETSEDK